MLIYSDIYPSEIAKIEELWNNNRDFHISIESDFKHLYRGLTFEERMQSIFSTNRKTVKITTVSLNEAVTGYCLSAISNTVGELISMHVALSMRGQGIGKELATRHLRWMRDMGCLDISLAVSPRNSHAISFYEGLGLRPSLIIMQLP